MNTVICPFCKQSNCKEKKLTRKASAIALASVGAWFGSSIGVATAGVGMAATIPLAIAGGAVGYLFPNKKFECVDCKKEFKI